MLLHDFLGELQELLRRESPLAPQMRLRDIEEWDSMAIMEVIAWFGESFNRELTFETFKRLETVGDVAALALEPKQP